MTVESSLFDEGASRASSPLRVLFLSRWLVATGGGGVQTYMSNAARALADAPIQLQFAALMPGSLPRFVRGPAHLGERGLPKWRNAWSLARWLRTRLPALDLVVFHGVTDWHFVVGAAQCRRAGVRYIARTAGGLLRVPYSESRLQHFRSQIFLRLVVARLLRRAACVIASTDRERDAILAIDRRIRVRIVPAGTDVPRDPPGAVSGIQPGSPLRLLFIGRLEPIKALPILFHAVRILDRERFPVTLDIVGAGDPSYDRELKAEVDALDIAGRVEFHGDLRGEAKLAVLRRSHLLILPSYSENFGFVVVEAMAQGIPVVVSDGVGLAECVRTCGAGQVFPKGQAERARRRGGRLWRFGIVAGAGTASTSVRAGAVLDRSDGEITREGLLGGHGEADERFGRIVRGGAAG